MRTLTASLLLALSLAGCADDAASPAKSLDGGPDGGASDAAFSSECRCLPCEYNDEGRIFCTTPL